MLLAYICRSRTAERKICSEKSEGQCIVKYCPTKEVCLLGAGSRIDKQLIRLNHKTREIVQHTFKEMAKDSGRNGLFIFTSWCSVTVSDSQATRIYRQYPTQLTQTVAPLSPILLNLPYVKFQRDVVIEKRDMVETVRDVAWSCNKREFTRAEVDDAWKLLYDVVANFIDIYRAEALKEMSNVEPNSVSD
uniref:Uncharacterized protein n=1 Tax=Parascaris univalens TaxID=6257 RepID=A0A915ACF9_PARUN